MIRDCKRMCSGWSITLCSPGNCSCPGHVMLHHLRHKAHSHPGRRDEMHFLLTLIEHKKVKLFIKGLQFHRVMSKGESLMKKEYKDRNGIKSFQN